MDAHQNTNDGDDTALSRSTFTFDDYMALGGMENYGGTASPPGHSSSFDTTVTVRGNVTGVTQFIDLVANTSITRLLKYDIFGNVTKAQVACCNQKTFGFDQNNYWSAATQLTNGDPAGTHLTSTMEDDFNTSLAMTETDPNSLSSNYTYDAALRLIQASLPSGASRIHTYNDASLSASSSVSSIDVNAAVSRVTDGWGQTTQSVNIHGGQVNATYDGLGRVQSVTNPFPQGGTPGPATTYQYDALGRLKTTTFPDGNTVQQSYSGPAITITDQVNRQIKRQVDSLGRLITTTEQDPSGSLIQNTDYTYDLLNNLTQVNQGGQLRTFQYDAASRLKNETTPETGTTSFTYTDFDAVLTRTDARGVVTTYTYDTLNRLTGVGYNTVSGVVTAPTVTYNYDNSSTSTTKGLMLSVSTGVYSETLSYDSFNRLSSTSRTIDSRTYATAYQYNPAGELTQLTYPSTRAVTINHDGSGRLASVVNNVDSANAISSFTYQLSGQLAGWTLGNGVVESRTYNNRQQLQTQTATKSGTLLTLTYGFNASAGQMGSGTTAGNGGQVMSITGTINGTTESASYTYDLLGRLATSNQSSNGSSAQRRFAYDRWGNRTGVWNATSGGTQIQTVVYQQSGGAPTNRINTVNGVSQTYDATGNVINDGAHSYSYDSENRLVNVDAGTTAQYAYDYRNWRVKKVASGGTTHYIWEAGHVIAEHNGVSGAQVIDYIYAGGRLIAKAPGTQLAGNGSTVYFLNDMLSARVLTDNAGIVAGKQGHLPFGEDFAESGTQDKHHFTSYERDGETGLDYAVNRSYASGTGRFAQADPSRGSASASDPRTWNRYSYTRNVLTNRVDPSGLLDDPEDTCPDGDCAGEDVIRLYGEADYPDEDGGGDVIHLYAEAPFPEEDDFGFSDFLPILAGDGTGVGEVGGGGAVDPAPQARRQRCAPPPGEAVRRDRTVSDAGLRAVTAAEAVVLHLYNDATGNCTIGYGHLVHRGRCRRDDRNTYGGGISQQQALDFYRTDIARAATIVNNSVNVPLSQNQFDALADFVFNIGHLQGTTLLRRLNAGNYDAVPGQLARYNTGRVRGRRRVLRGLVRRRRAEGRLFCTQ
ncbi:MAG TPA: RHS repeat-associated core domain-containing protein [Blastocatellia bacterium]|nr:RHS repeat-associated core domain-containing protein [Blastocatellia bacterium]